MVLVGPRIISTALLKTKGCSRRVSNSPFSPPTPHPNSGQVSNMPFLKREGRDRVYYEVHGSGTPLLLTHGYSSNSVMWQGQIAAFTKAGYKLIIWDMRGHGRSSYPSDQSAYSERHTVADMIALLDKVCGPESTSIVGGLSLGGYMSQAFYRDHPQRVETLLIIGMVSDRADHPRT